MVPGSKIVIFLVTYH